MITPQENPKNNPIEITEADLPLSCPRPQDSLWNAHPRVFLPIDRNSTHGQVICPYCSRHYVLKK